MNNCQLPAVENKKGKGCCLWILIIFSVIFLALFILGYFLANDDSSKIKKEQCQKRQDEDSLIFSAFLKPDYSLTEMEEKELDQRLEQLIKQGNPPDVKSSISLGDAEKKMKEELNKKFGLDFLLKDEQGVDDKTEKIGQAKSLMKKLKDNYPEAYFLIAKHILKKEIKEEPFYLFFTGNNQQSANVLVHELSHGAEGDMIDGEYFSKRCYWIEDKFLCIPETIMLPEGREVFSQMEKTNDFDREYLQEANQNIFASLDEIISYTKSVRVARVFRCLDSDNFQPNSGPENLSRQLYLFSLQLKNIKENHPKLWVELSRKRGLVFIANRVMEIAKKELELYLAASSDTEKENIRENLELFGNNSNYFNALLGESKILEMKDRDLNEKELEKLDILVKYVR